MRKKPRPSSASASSSAVSGGIGVATTSEPPTARRRRRSPASSPAPARTSTATIAALQDTLRRVPGDHVSWANLAVAYVEQARVTGNATYYDKADEAAARSFERRAGRQLRRPGGPGRDRRGPPRLLRRADERRRRRWPSTRATSAPWPSASTPSPSSAGTTTSCSALRTADRLPAEHGDRRPLLLRLRAARRPRPRPRHPAPRRRRRLARGQGLPADPAPPTSCASRAACAPPAATSRSCRQAVPGYLPALVSSARLQTARGDLEGAVATWQDVVARQPLPEYLTELGELLQHLGRTDEADAQFAVVRTTIELLDASGVDTDLETALFEADHGSAARALDAGPRRVAPAARASTSPTPSPGRCTATAATREALADRPGGHPARLAGGEVLDPPRHHRGRARG